MTVGPWAGGRRSLRQEDPARRQRREPGRVPVRRGAAVVVVPRADRGRQAEIGIRVVQRVLVGGRKNERCRTRTTCGATWLTPEERVSSRLGGDEVYMQIRSRSSVRGSGDRSSSRPTFEGSGGSAGPMATQVMLLRRVPAGGGSWGVGRPSEQAGRGGRVHARAPPGRIGDCRPRRLVGTLADAGAGPRDLGRVLAVERGTRLADGGRPEAPLLVVAVPVLHAGLRLAGEDGRSVPRRSGSPVRRLGAGCISSCSPSVSPYGSRRRGG